MKSSRLVTALVIQNGLIIFVCRARSPPGIRTNTLLRCEESASLSGLRHKGIMSQAFSFFLIIIASKIWDD